GFPPGDDPAAGAGPRAESGPPAVPAAPVNSCLFTGDTGAADAVTAGESGTMELIHDLEPLLRRDRPQDPARDGAGLRFRPLGSRREGGVPAGIELRDARRRTCVYLPAGDDRPETNEATSPRGEARTDGSGLQFETLRHGGDFDDAMPQAIRLTDADGRRF